MFQVLGLSLSADDIDDESEQVLRKLNNIDFKLQMHSQNCMDNLNDATAKALKIVQETELINQMKDSTVAIQSSLSKTLNRKESEAVTEFKSDLVDLITVDNRIRQS